MSFAATRRHLGTSDLEVSPLCLGGNVFGWTADVAESHAVLDRYLQAGGNFLDTADQYSNWVPGHVGGESETVIGEWLRRRPGARDEVVLATKVGHSGALGVGGGLTRESIERRTEASLRRLGVDYVDVLYAHHDDPTTTLEETLSAFDEIVRKGKARCVAASNYTPERLREALEVSDRLGLSRFATLQARYNLLERDQFEGPLAELCRREGLGCVPYWVLAKGFLTGKYRRPGGDVEDGVEDGLSERVTLHQVRDFGTRRAWEILDVAVDVAEEYGVSVAAAILAWTATRPQVVAPIASARTVGQLDELLRAPLLTGTEELVLRLTDASQPESL